MLTRSVPTPAGRDLRVAVPLRQQLLPDVEELFGQLPPLNVTRMFANTGELGGSNHLQGTKPQTIGCALADSPAGRAAWIYEKYPSKTDNTGLAEDVISIDDMLDVISLYWYTDSAA